MDYRVEFLPEAAREFEALNDSLKKVAAKQIDKLADRPELISPDTERYISAKRRIASSTKSSAAD